MSSLNSLAGSLSFAVFAFVFGLFADALSPRSALIVGEILTLPVILLYWKIFRNK